ncbi:putative membrane protein [Sphingobium sp. B2D3A]|uniref:urate hydroxylase PuuD n=1 Tax=Sphingobium TaxID=165695 RepID=UPI0015EC3C14|nr:MULTISPECIES: urate hydroxylase PuuD [Sphingobium]MCW2336161.1 putative membrane protein [Sphingobium sp. B2D3A]MCW2348616.1 putative membrane protein [Sphingobium sp. B12D2B]MCW2363728.1 putative membrane protein [Sphingobium sp. B10D3B]MCW2385916.1 putative membrane protein [Sphingobium sp. B2D3D]MCW2402874.1 putative membrane protein [Sphingobium sp. B10D7B]
MTKLFGNLHLVLLIGVILTLAVIYGIGPNGESVSAALRWLHTFFGILWIGLLYYFNFVQIPTMPKVPAELKPGVSKFIAPSALFFFRWAAALTVLTGLLVAWRTGYLHEAFAFKAPYQLIGLGMWLALIMAINVWFVIWPAQKKALGLVAADDATKASAATRAMIFSRTNTLLSIPMLYCMVNFNGG